MGEKPNRMKSDTSERPRRAPRGRTFAVGKLKWELDGGKDQGDLL